MSRNNQTNIHHLCNKTSGGTNDPRNLKEMLIRTHNAFHEVFKNDMPHESFIRLRNILTTSLSEEFRYKVNKLLEEKDPQYYLVKGVWRR